MQKWRMRDCQRIPASEQQKADYYKALLNEDNADLPSLPSEDNADSDNAEEGTRLTKIKGNRLSNTTCLTHVVSKGDG